jgi:hypothetical protein
VKWNTGSAIEDPEREQKILQDVGAKAKQANLPPQWVQHFFRLQIEAAKLVQYQIAGPYRSFYRRRRVHRNDRSRNGAQGSRPIIFPISNPT